MLPSPLVVLCAPSPRDGAVLSNQFTGSAVAPPQAQLGHVALAVISALHPGASPGEPVPDIAG